MLTCFATQEYDDDMGLQRPQIYCIHHKHSPLSTPSALKLISYCHLIESLLTHTCLMIPSHFIILQYHHTKTTFTSCSVTWNITTMQQFNAPSSIKLGQISVCYLLIPLFLSACNMKKQKKRLEASDSPTEERNKKE